jgi:AcrR family transcriptional regulator
MTDTAPSVRPPQQARSQATLTRLLETAREMLTDTHWRDLGVTELCDRASSSVGSFYARFAGKEALLESLATDARSELAEVARWCQADARRRGLPTPSRLRQLTAALDRYTERQGGVLRALAAQGRALPWQDRQVRSTLAGSLTEEDVTDDTRHQALGMLLAACATRATGTGIDASPDPEALARMLALYLADQSPGEVSP